MHSLIIHPEAHDDLRRIRLTDQWSAARVFVILQELDGDEDLLSCLCVQHFHRHPPREIDACRWSEVFDEGRNIWRLKVWGADDNLLPYRIIYAHKEQDCEFHVLAIVHRSWDYDVNHAVSQRIFAAYDEL